MLVKLNPGNQTKLIVDDCARVGRDARPHYSVMQHILLLSQRMDRLDAIADQSPEGRDATRLDAQHAGAVAKPIAKTSVIKDHS